MSLRPASIHSMPTNQVQFNGHSVGLFIWFSFHGFFFISCIIFLAVILNEWCWNVIAFVVYASCCYLFLSNIVVIDSTHHFTCFCVYNQKANGQETNESLEDAGNELILTDEEIVRFQIGEVFAHVPKEEVESRIEEMTEKTSKNLVKLEEEKESIVAQMAALKKILYGKFKDSINLEED